MVRWLVLRVRLKRTERKGAKDCDREGFFFI